MCFQFQCKRFKALSKEHKLELFIYYVMELCVYKTVLHIFSHDSLPGLRNCSVRSRVWMMRNVKKRIQTMRHEWYN